MRGLTIFITDIRKCKGKDEELKRIYKELANIRNKFNGNKPVDGYQKKKYVCKLLFIFLLGYDNEFGHMEAVNLLSSNAYSEKMIGYLFISVVMGQKNDFIPLIINSIRNDLLCSNKMFQNLALQFIANTASSDVAQTLYEHVLDIVISNDTDDFVRQTAVLALLQVFRIESAITLDDLQQNRIINLLSHHHLGVVTASASLIDFLAKKYTLQFQACIPVCIIRLNRLVTSGLVDLNDYNYYCVAAPWLIVKLLKILQNFPLYRDMGLRIRLKDTLEKILNTVNDPPKSKKYEHTNAKYAVIFEAISFIIQTDFDSSILQRATKIWGNVLHLKESNIRFMALEMMSQLSNNERCMLNIKTQWKPVLNVLRKETDITLKKQAVDLLYNICDSSNAKFIVDELIFFLEGGNEYSVEVVLKAAGLAENFGTNSNWYVDSIIKIMQICGDVLDDNIWFTLVKVIAENNHIQQYAARASYIALHENPCPDVMTKAAGYILGEYGYLIAKNTTSSPLKQLNILKMNYCCCSPSARAVLLTTYVKFLNLYPDLKNEIQSILKDKCNSQCANEEIQQRAVEYMKLSEIGSKKLLASVFDEMPSTFKRKTAVVEAIEKRKSQKLKTGQIERSSSLKDLTHSVSLGSIVERSDAENVLIRSVSHSNVCDTSKSANVLVDILKETSKSSQHLPSLKSAPSPPTSIYPINQKFLHNFLFSETGVMFENSTIRILIDCEFKQHYGKFHLKYINTSGTPLDNFVITGNFSNTNNKCSIWFKPSQSVLQVDGFMEQDIHLECLSQFSAKPGITLKFICNREQRIMKLLLPLTLNKFVEPCSMPYDAFRKRWKDFEQTGKEVVKEFPAKYPMIYGITQQKLKGFRISVIENIDSGNFYGAGIFYSGGNRMGFLIQLDRFLVINRYRSSVKSSDLGLCQIISDLLVELL